MGCGVDVSETKVIEVVSSLVGLAKDIEVDARKTSEETVKEIVITFNSERVYTCIDCRNGGRRRERR